MTNALALTFDDEDTLYAQYLTPVYLEHSYRLPSPASPLPPSPTAITTQPTKTLSMRSTPSPAFSAPSPSPEDLGLLKHAFSPVRKAQSRQYPSPSLTGGRASDRQGGADDRLRAMSPSPASSSSQSNSAGVKSASEPTTRPKRERQTTIQEHLRAVKPSGSPSPSNSVKSTSSVSLSSTNKASKKTGRSSRSSTAALELVEGAVGLGEPRLDKVASVTSVTEEREPTLLLDVSTSDSTGTTPEQVLKVKQELMGKLVSFGFANFVFPHSAPRLPR